MFCKLLDNHGYDKGKKNHFFAVKRNKKYIFIYRKKRKKRFFQANFIYHVYLRNELYFSKFLNLDLEIFQLQKMKGNLITSSYHSWAFLFFLFFLKVGTFFFLFFLSSKKPVTKNLRILL